MSLVISWVVVLFQRVCDIFYKPLLSTLNSTMYVSSFIIMGVAVIVKAILLFAVKIIFIHKILCLVSLPSKYCE